MIDLLRLKASASEQLQLEGVMEDNGPYTLLDPNPGQHGPMFLLPKEAIIGVIQDTARETTAVYGEDHHSISTVYLRRDAIVFVMLPVKVNDSLPCLK